jgi:pyroglutamyl-peptidase
MGISIERLGININDARIADNEGNKPSDQLIEDDGPTAYFTTINAKKTYDALQKQGIPAKVSYSAGTFVCNNLIYGVMHFLTQKKMVDSTKFGFLHIPYLPAQVASKTKLFPSMSLSLIEKAVPIIIKTNL